MPRRGVDSTTTNGSEMNEMINNYALMMHIPHHMPFIFPRYFLSKQAILPVIYPVQKGVGVLNRFSNRVENRVESTGCENRVNNMVSYLYF